MKDFLFIAGLLFRPFYKFIVWLFRLDKEEDMDRLDKILEFLESLYYDDENSIAEPLIMIYSDGSGNIYDSDDVDIISFGSIEDLFKQMEMKDD